MSATLIYLNIDFGSGWVAGESTAAGFLGQIEIESFGWDMKVGHRRDVDANSAESKGTVEPGDVTLEKFFDKSSTVLVQNMQSQTAFTVAHLVFADMVVGDSEPTKVMKIVLEDGHVEDVRLAGSGSGKGMAVKESVTLSFRKIALEYFPPGATKDVRAAASVSWTYDFAPA